MDRDPWTVETVKAGLSRFYRELAGVGLVFPRADRPTAVEYGGYPVMRLRWIEGLEYVEETVVVLGSSTELAHHLFRQCWVEGTNETFTLSVKVADLCRVFGWEVDAHAFKVAEAAGLVAIAHNSRITVDRRQKGVSGARHARSLVASQA
jgi:hypothetical protein